MNLNAVYEFEQMIHETALDDQALPGRAVVPLKRLLFLKPHDVPEPLRGQLRELQSMGAHAQDMDKDEARAFISRIISFHSQLTPN
jgi:hypothetical protein